MNSAIRVFITNLDILSKLEKNEKIKTTDHKYDIVKPTALHIDGLLRWATDRDRTDDMDVISHDYETVFLIADLMLESKSIKNKSEGDISNDEKLDTLCEIHRSLLNSIDGLDKLCGTYIDDALIRDRIRELINNIIERVKKLRVQLTEYGCVVTADLRPLKYA